MSEADVIEFTVSREKLYPALQLVSGAVERKQSMEILSHVWIGVNEQQISLLATDLEVELQAYISPNVVTHPGQFTIPARKIIDICRSLPAEAELRIVASGEKVLIRSGRSRFNLLARETDDFPRIKPSQNLIEFNITEQALVRLLEGCYFAMAQQDVRVFFNGALVEFNGNQIDMVATNGHRLAKINLQDEQYAFDPLQVILPRKSVLELLRLLEKTDQVLGISVSEHHVTLQAKQFSFTSRLLEGRYPDYRRAIPRRSEQMISLDNELLKQALSRVAILSNEKVRSVYFDIKANLLRIVTNNLEQEEAEELLEIDYQGPSVEFSVNVTYVIDVLSALPTGAINLYFTDQNASILLDSSLMPEALYVIMPMRY